MASRKSQVMRRKRRLQVPVNTPALNQADGASPQGILRYHISQVFGPPYNFEAFLNEVSLRLSKVQARRERKLGVLKHEKPEQSSK